MNGKKADFESAFFIPPSGKANNKMKKNTPALLREQLPPLLFDQDRDFSFQDSPLAQEYLDFYHINFVRELEGVRHGFGCLDANGYRIASHYWLPRMSKGTLVLVHGYYDHLGIYGHLIRFALQNGYAVLGFELPGHGLSSGAPAVIDSFETYADVLQRVVQRAADCMPKPWHVIGQSTGSAVILKHLWRYDLHPFDKVMLLAPLVRSYGWRRVSWSHSFLKFFLTQIPRGVSRSSHDDDFNHFITKSDPLQPRIVSVRWVGAMKEWQAELRKATPKPQRVLLVQGDADTTVDWRFNIPLIQSKLPDNRVHTIKGARHQLLNESEKYRAQVFGALRDYLVCD